MYNEDTAITLISQEGGVLTDTIFNKLAQLPTALQSADIQKLNRRAKSKWYSDQISKPLSELDSPLKDYYLNSLTCNQSIKREGKKLTSKYCNARHCNICNRIRTAKSINHYQKEFEKLQDLEFTTLTIPNCNKEELKQSIELIIKSFSNITRVIREKRKINFNGIRKIEITYNSQKDTYHPHIHLLHSGNCGFMFIEEWLKRFPKASIKAQDTRQANKDSIKELFKYTTKVLVKDSIDRNTINIFLPAIDNILLSMRNKRSFQSFGKIRIISEDVEELQSEEYNSLNEEYRTYYNWEIDNWYDFYNTEALTNFIIPKINFKIYD
jgi:hypothetical protein